MRQRDGRATIREVRAPGNLDDCTRRGRGSEATRPTYDRKVILIDVPRWPAHDTLWAHLVSDTSLEELHAFAERLGLPRRGFDLDHYDVPAERYEELVAAGATEVTARELVTRLRASGLRVRGKDRDAERARRH